MSERIIVSRHPAAAEFIARELGGKVYDGPANTTELGWRINLIAGHYHCARCGYSEANVDGSHCDYCDLPRYIRVIAEAAPDDVRGKIVYGNLPLHLAALATEVHAIEFDGKPPRGQEYTLEDMIAAGARLAVYCVHAGDRASLYNSYRGAV